jgi:hypothetical protein
MRHLRGIAVIGVVWLCATGFSAPIEDLRQEIRALKTAQATVAQREESLMVRQDELSRAIKRLKSTSRGQAGPFGPRRLETALQQLRAVLDERESLQRQRTELSVRIDEALTRLRTAVRDEILQIVSGNAGATDADDRTKIRALLTLYPPSPTLPSMPLGDESAAILPPLDPETLTEQTLLLRDQRERHDVILRRAETVHYLLTEELTLYRTLAERETGFETHWSTVDRQVGDARALIDALNERMYRMDEALRQLDVLMSQPATGP